MMRKRIALLLAVFLIVIGAAGMAEDYSIDEANMEHFSVLLNDLLTAYEAPSGEDEQRIETDLEAIRAVRDSDGEIAQSIADHWRTVYLDVDYPLCIHDGSERATALEAAMPADIGVHAFVVLGYELKDGEMTEELIGRCEAAAAAARSFPDSILVCSGGATGENNPDGHTEAGLMKTYLSENCGIDARRIFVDERAMTTVDNAINTFDIMEANGIESMTIVTSTYHQRWGQAIYNAVGALYGMSHGNSVRIVGNYCFDTEPSNEMFKNDARIAVRQLSSVLGLPQDERKPQKKPN